MAGRPVPVPQTFVNRPSATPAGQPGYIPVTGGSYNPVTQSFIPTVQPSGVGPPLPPVATPTVTPAATGGGGGGVTGGGGTTVTPPPAFSASQILENLLFAATGISGLGGWASDLAARGATPQEIVQSLRYGTDTSDAGKAAYASYLSAFPKMDKFIKEGVFSGESPELQYIEYRNSVREAGARYNVGEDLLTKDKIASYIEGRNSYAEIVSRMGTAAAAIATTPVETFAVLDEYYGVKSTDLMSFYLDTNETEANLQKRYTAARIGTEAARQRFGVDVNVAENLAQRGVSVDDATKGFALASQRSGLMAGRGDTVSREGLVGASFGSESDQAAVDRAAAARLVRFEHGGGFIRDVSGVTGLAGANV